MPSAARTAASEGHRVRRLGARGSCSRGEGHTNFPGLFSVEKAKRTNPAHIKKEEPGIRGVFVRQ